MKTIFNHELIAKMITASTKTVPGVKNVNIYHDKICLDKNLIDVDVWFEDEMTNICLIASELQKRIFFDLFQKLDNPDLKINITIRV